MTGLGIFLPPPQESGLGLSVQTGSSSSSGTAPPRRTPQTCSSLHGLVTQHGRPPSPDNSEHMSPHLRSDELGEDNAQHNMLLIRVDDGDEIMPTECWHDRDIEIALDSGRCNHVLDAEDAPGYSVVESPGSRRGQHFIVGSGERVPNEGQVRLHMEASGNEGHVTPVQSTLQVAGQQAADERLQSL